MSLPALVTQLDDGTATADVDCACCTIINGAKWISGGKAGPQRQQDVAAYIHQIRATTHNLHSGLLMQGDTLEFYQSAAFRHWFTRVGETPPKVEYFKRIPWATLRSRLRRGQFAHVAIDYGRLNDGKAPSGSLSFRGDHSVGLAQPWMRGTRLMCHVADSLMDGRTRWVNGRWYKYPRGWQIVRVADFRAAAAAWGNTPPGDGFATAIFLTPR